MLGNKHFLELTRTHGPRKYKKTPVNTGRHDIFLKFIYGEHWKTGVFLNSRLFVVREIERKAQENS